MYCTRAKLNAKQGAAEGFSRIGNGRRPAGYLGSYVFKSDKYPAELWLVAFRINKATYAINSNSPEQD